MKLALLLAFAVSAAQLPTRDAVSTPQRTGTLRGRVVAAITSEPLHRVRIVVNTSTPDPPAGVTDTRGEFEITDIAPGTYTVTATRAGFLTLQYGQRWPRETGRRVSINAGEIADIQMALPRGGVLAGSVSDESGEPYANVTVEAVELRYVRGRRVPVQAASTPTNDLGQFRLSGLEPGTYMLRASTTETWMDDAGAEAMAYAITYFPGVTATEEARVVSVNFGKEVADLRFALRPGPAARLDGVLLDRDGNPMANEAISLSRVLRGVGGRLFASGGGGTARTNAQGRFEFTGLAPGEYTVGAGTNATRVAETVIVSTGDAKSVTIAQKARTTLQGSVVAADGKPLPFAATLLRVTPISLNMDELFAAWDAPREASVGRDGAFRLDGIDGAYLVRLTGLPDDWMLTSVTLAGSDYIDRAVDLAPGSVTTGLRLVVSPHGGRIIGTVTQTNGKPVPDTTVIVFPPEPGRWTLGSRFIKVTRPDTEGRFEITGLPAGNYRVAARFFVAEGQWEDREFLTSLLGQAAAAQVIEGEAISVTVRAEQQP